MSVAPEPPGPYYPGASAGAAGSAVLPSDVNAQAWTGDPGSVPSQAVGVAAGVPFLTMFRYAGGTIHTMWMDLTLAGVTLTVNENFMFIVNTAGIVVAQSVDQSAAWAAVGIAGAALASPATLGPGAYYAGVLANGATVPTVKATNTPTGGLTTVNASGAQLRAANNGAGVTAVPASFNLANNVAVLDGLLIVMT